MADKSDPAPLSAFDPRRSAHTRQGPHPVRLIAGALVVVVLGVWAFVTLSGGFTKTAGGEIVVVRNGGPLDNNRIRQIVPPASSLTWTGLYSQRHTYPAQQRFYTITADTSRGDRTGVDVENLPTADGVEVGVEGTVYFALNLDPTTLKAFDDKYGTRKYRGQDGSYRYAWEDEAGWSTFLDQIIRPVISNDLREQIGNFPCSELQASCALVRNGGNVQQVSTKPGSSNLNIAKIQQSINTSLADDLKSTLGGPYITGVRFNLAKISLPQRLQDAINSAQAAFAGVTEAQAKVQQAKAEAQANQEREKGYQSCPACAQIDMLKAIPPNVTTYAPGTSVAVTPSK